MSLFSSPHPPLHSPPVLSSSSSLGFVSRPFEFLSNFTFRHFSPSGGFTADPLSDSTLKFSIHNNGIILIYLSPSHPIISRSLTIRSLNYLISLGSNSGKRKKGASVAHANTPICDLICENGEKFKISATITGKLIDLNHRIRNLEPDQIRSNFDSLGWIAALQLQPKLMKSIIEGNNREKKINEEEKEEIKINQEEI